MDKLKDYIHVMDALTPNVCNNIIKESQYSRKWEQSWTGTGSSDYRTCSQLSLLNSRYHRILTHTIKESYSEYVKKCQNYENSCSQMEALGLMRYEKGQEYKLHTDVGEFNRLLSVSIVLNEDYEGGELIFFRDDYTNAIKYEEKINLKAGQICMFPSNRLYPHKVLPVTNGVRYAVVTWLHHSKDKWFD